MHFAQINYFHLIWPVILISLFLFWARNYHKRVMRRFAQKQLIDELAADYDKTKSIQRNIILIFVFIFCTLALSRPQWGFEWQEIKRKGMDILVVIDVSKSMLTQDVKPNRLERTKLAVKDLIRKLKGDRIGLIAFAGDAFLVCPLTVDYNGFLLSLNDLDTNAVPRGGTNIAQAIKEAIKSYDDTPNKFKAIVVITDGDNLEGNPVAQANTAKEKGIKIYTIGIGTSEGELIQITTQSGEKEFLKDNQGNFVKSRLNETLLQKLSLLTDALYVKASGAEFGLDLIYERELSQIEKREIESKMERKYHERFQIPLALAAILLFIESCMYSRKKRFF